MQLVSLNHAHGVRTKLPARAIVLKLLRAQLDMESTRIHANAISHLQ
jgi:hypothetical protein